MHSCNDVINFQVKWYLKFSDFSLTPAWKSSFLLEQVTLGFSSLQSNNLVTEPERNSKRNVGEIQNEGQMGLNTILQMLEAGLKAKDLPV